MRQLCMDEPVAVSVPASKSVVNRALLLAAFSRGETRLVCGQYGADTEALLGCLRTLGVAVSPAADGLTVRGGTIASRAKLFVGSAGTVARFLTAVLAFRGGDYEMTASEQMSRRPMEVLSLLSSLGVRVEYRGEPLHFPFRMVSEGVTADGAEIDTNVSTQYASGLMLAAALGKRPFTVALTGNRDDGSYIRMTARVIRAFGGEVLEDGARRTVYPVSRPTPAYTVEPDPSAACYFYALALLLGEKVLVRGVHPRTEGGETVYNGDLRFLQLLAQAGVRLTDTAEGLIADGSGLDGFDLGTVDVRDFSDQALTLAALAPFAKGPTRLRGVAHIRKQECDRVRAIVENLRTLGVPASATDDEIEIVPAPVKGGTVRTFEDHRVAMAFALIGLKTGNVTIENPLCCRKTFENYFELLDSLTK